MLVLASGFGVAAHAMPHECIGHECLGDDDPATSNAHVGIHFMAAVGGPEIPSYGENAVDCCDNSICSGAALAAKPAEPMPEILAVHYLRFDKDQAPSIRPEALDRPPNI
jgi:hypothetical protein